MSKCLIVGALLLLFTACEKDEPETPVIPNEEEVITTLIYTLTNVVSDEEALMYFNDPDGDGGIEPTQTADTLEANTTYTGYITLLNELESPAEDITEEVEEEGDEHQFFYVSSTDSIMVAYTDTDVNGNPVGIHTLVTTGGPGTSTFTIVLKHEPNKYGEGVSEGDMTNAGGETDIEVVFNVVVE